MKPFKLKPAYKQYIWGGQRLQKGFNKQPQGDTLAESWEVSAHPDGQSMIATGEYAGMGFGDFTARYPQAVGGGEFPILIKLIDAAQSLSIQVHPDDEYARRVEGDLGKTEMWYILDNLPGSYIYLGFEQPTDRQAMRHSIEQGSITDRLRKVPARKGDVFFIPAGTIHAIGAGLLIAEVQQSSNSTYRVYDFGRVDADGNPRELHIEKALDVTNMQPAEFKAPGAGRLSHSAEHALDRLASCAYFTVDKLRLHRQYDGNAMGFLAVICIEGDILLECRGERLRLEKGESAFIPAGEPCYTLSGQGECLLCGPGEVHI